MDNERVLMASVDDHVCLLLTNVQRDENGAVIGGDVVNGAWKMRIKDGSVFADGVNVCPVPTDTRFIDVLPTERGNYNDVIEAVLDRAVRNG